MRWKDLEKQDCSIAKSLAIFGDMWTIMILRDCFLGVRSFDGFAKSLGISRAIISDRLANLVKNGILEKRKTNNGLRGNQYFLSPKGLSVYPIILAIVKWGDENFYSSSAPPVSHIHKLCGHKLSPVFICSECGVGVDPKEVKAVIRGH